MPSIQYDNYVIWIGNLSFINGTIKYNSSNTYGINSRLKKQVADIKANCYEFKTFEDEIHFKPYFNGLMYFSACFKSLLH